MLEALEGIHRAGFLHRDVKPANFALALGAPGPAAPGAWRVLDFGLARRFVGEAGEVLPAREGGEFRGSTTYASVQAHLKQDLGAGLAGAGCGRVGRQHLRFLSFYPLSSRFQKGNCAAQAWTTTCAVE